MFTRRNLRLVCSTVVLAFLSFCVSSRAQVAGKGMSFNVPFDFQLGSTHLSAGVYRVSMLGEHFVELHNASTSALHLTNWAQAMKPARTSKVVFRRYGKQYFLRELWPTPGTSHFECPESKEEKRSRDAELAMASDGTSPDIALALLKIP